MRNSNIDLCLRTKSLFLIIALTMILCGTLGGTLAWLFDKSDVVTNTFTYGDISIQLNETDPEGNNNPLDNTYSMDINNSVGIFKDPKIAVLANSEACWLFVRITQSNSFRDYMDYTISSSEDGWKLYKNVSEYESIYYQIVEKDTEEQVYHVLENDKVYLKEGITQEQLDALDEKELPTLTIYAYAIQRSQIVTVEDAWEKCLNK